MLNYNLDSVQAANKLVQLCEKYHEDMDIDIVHGRQVIDGRSLLGVFSLIWHFVTVNPIGTNNEKIKEFEKELKDTK